MLNNLHFSPSFQKKLLATTTLNDCGKKIPCQIYKLNSPQDTLYLNQQMNSENWLGYHYLDTFYSNFAEDKFYKSPYINFYTLENEKGDLLGYLEEMKNENIRKVLYLETVPTMAKGTKNRRVKGIGETMMAFLASLSLNSEKVEDVWISYPSNDSELFYKKLGFERPSLKSRSLHLPLENVIPLIWKNEERNGSEIKFVEGNDDK